MKLIATTFALLCAITAHAQSTHTLWYDRPAEFFEETLVLGNGKIGASVFGGVAVDSMFLNDATLWTGGPVDPNMNPDAHKNIPAIRESLANEDYALAEKALSQGLGAPVPFSLSRAIEADKKAYYAALERAQQSNEITKWLEYFIPVALRALEDAEAEVLFIAKKAQFFDRFRGQLNERQLKVVRRMLDEGAAGFEGGMNARKYGGITGASKATATRDLQGLQQLGAMRSVGGREEYEV